MLIHRHGDPEVAHAAETAILDDESLSNAARGLLLRILRHAPEWEINAEGISALAKESRENRGESVGAVRACFRELEQRGYLVRKRVRMGRRGLGTQMNFHDTPQSVEPPNPTPEPGHPAERVGYVVYIVGQPGNPRVKIGYTKNIRTRLVAYQTHSPIELEVLWTCYGGFALEQEIHREFKAFRIHGEWFDFRGKDPVAAVARFVRGFDAIRLAAIENRLAGSRLGDENSEFEWAPLGAEV